MVSGTSTQDFENSIYAAFTWLRLRNAMVKKKGLQRGGKECIKGTRKTVREREKTKNETQAAQHDTKNQASAGKEKEEKREKERQ